MKPVTASEFAALPPEEQEARLTEMARTAIGLYELPAQSEIRLLNLSENATFLIEDPHTNYRAVLRIHRPGYHSDEAIRSELRWLQALAGHSEVATAQPIPGKNGDLLQILSHAAVPEDRRAVLFTWLPGKEPDPSDIRSFEQLGAVTAWLHLHIREWPEASAMTRHTWDLESMFFGERPLWGRWQDGVGMSPERLRLLSRLAETLRERLTAYGKHPHNFGLIHADLRLANLLLHNGKVHVIDFDDCGHSWLMYDLASALSFIEDQPQVPELVQAWLRGYRSVEPLDPEHEQIIPTLIMARRLLLVAWVGSHQEAPFPRQLGEGFTSGTCALAERYLAGKFLMG